MNLYAMERENKKFSRAVTSEIPKIFCREEKKKPMGKGMLRPRKLKEHKTTQKMPSLGQTPWHRG